MELRKCLNVCLSPLLFLMLLVLLLLLLQNLGAVPGKALLLLLVLQQVVLSLLVGLVLLRFKESDRVAHPKLVVLLTLRKGLGGPRR